MLLIKFDIHRNISSAQAFILYKTSKSVDSIHIILGSENLTLCFYSKSVLNSQVNVIFPTKFLYPCSVSSIFCRNCSFKPIINIEENFVKWIYQLAANENLPSSDQKIAIFETTFRLQIANNIIREYSSGINIAKKFKDFMKDKYEKFKIHYLICSNCSSLLNDKPINCLFYKTYDDKTSDLAENWFCHKHDDPRSLDQKDDLLYISEIFFYFHISVIKLLKLSENNKEYKCITCSSVLSLKKKMNCSDYIGFFCDKILLQESEAESYNIEKYKNETALLSFSSMLEDVLESTVSCKIYIQSKVDSKIDCLLLWINCPKIVQFLYNEISGDTSPNEIEFRGQEVFKVLYNITPHNSELAVKWQRDFNVDFFQISDNTMKVISQLLKESSEYFPHDQETVNGFSFGYLPVGICHKTL